MFGRKKRLLFILASSFLLIPGLISAQVYF